MKTFYHRSRDGKKDSQKKLKSERILALQEKLQRQTLTPILQAMMKWKKLGLMARKQGAGPSGSA